MFSSNVFNPAKYCRYSYLCMIIRRIIGTFLWWTLLNENQRYGTACLTVVRVTSKWLMLAKLWVCPKFNVLLCLYSKPPTRNIILYIEHCIVHRLCLVKMFLRMKWRGQPTCTSIFPRLRWVFPKETLHTTTTLTVGCTSYGICSTMAAIGIRM